MKVIMSSGKIQEVADGYARNYLFPRKLATPATKSALVEAEKRQKDVDDTESKTVEEYGKMAHELASQVVTLQAKANESGTLFAAVTPQMIAEQLSAQHSITVPVDCIVIDEPIKHVGESIVKVRLPKQAEVTLKVVI